MSKLYNTLLFLVGLINFVPVVALISLEKINHSYGLNVVDANLAILLRHRALLFGVIGGFIIYSVFKPKYQIAAMLIAAISMFGYLSLFYSIGGYNQELLNVAKADMLGVTLLIAAVVTKFFLNEN